MTFVLVLRVSFCCDLDKNFQIKKFKLLYCDV